MYANAILEALHTSCDQARRAGDGRTIIGASLSEPHIDGTTGRNHWGERSEPHTCGENGKLSIYLFIYIYIYIYIFIYMVRAYSVYAFCPICARCNISALNIGFMYY